jgi:hypothetical protein
MSNYKSGPWSREQFTRRLNIRVSLPCAGTLGRLRNRLSMVTDALQLEAMPVNRLFERSESPLPLAVELSGLTIRILPNESNGSGWRARLQ